jgi:dynein heavy chain, axonemal
MQVEAAMVAALHRVTADAVAAHATNPRIEWVLSWPGQIVLAVTAIYWTAAVGRAIESGGAGALAAAAGACTRDLNAVVEKVRSELSRLQRATLSALVVMDVHARDVTAALAAEGIEGAPGHFSWTSQLRLYWENTNPDEPEQRGLPIRMMNASAEYGYEYLGNSSRLVVTPLTDRCYRCAFCPIFATLCVNHSGYECLGNSLRLDVTPLMDHCCPFAWHFCRVLRLHRVVTSVLAPRHEPSARRSLAPAPPGTAPRT